MMTDNILIKYMEDRFKLIPDPIDYPSKHLPFITISREYGCQANLIAEMVLNKLQELRINTDKNPWKLINKEIISKSASELNLKETQIKYVFDSQERSTMDEVLAAISARYYKSDKKIRKTIADVIKSTAKQGNVIIVGRGGVAITRDMKNSLHIKLIGPFKERVKSIAKRKQLTDKQAMAFVKEMDEKRKKLVSNLYSHTELNELYDVIYNTSTLSPDEIAQSIVDLLLQKKNINLLEK
ncbi:MAG: cytidylate kinase-like family protein [Bacteroidales bacterium]|nr:cytidylate kinase-like family protein [Bacteroidales bacterium]